METFKKRLLIASVGFVLLFMLFGSHGSFNPTKIGFYTSILAGVLFFFLTYYGFRAISSNKKEE